MLSLSKSPQHIRSVFSNSFMIYKLIWAPIFPFIFIMSILSCFLAILPPLIEPILPVNAENVLSLDAVLKSFVFHKPLMWIFAALTLLLLYFSAAVLYKAYHKIFSSNKACSFLSVLSVTLRKYPVCLIAFVLFSICFFAGFILLVFPGVFLFTLFYFYLLIIMAENKGAIDALESSAILVWSHWWRTFIVAILPIIVCEILFGRAARHFTPILIDAFKITPGLADSISECFWTTVYTFFIIPWLFSLQLSQYHDLKERLEFRIKGKFVS